MTRMRAFVSIQIKCRSCELDSHAIIYLLAVLDAEQYVELLQKRQLSSLPSPPSDDHLSLSDEKEFERNEQEEKILTEDDVKLAQRGLPPQQYHAFVLYADEDIEFATELIERMESAGLKVRTNYYLQKQRLR